MGLAETQRALARVYTDACLRKRFFADPVKVGEELGLVAEAAQQLAQLSEHGTNLFSASLRRKRFKAVSELLPLTYRVLGDRAVFLFEKYTEVCAAQGAQRHRDDALAFAAYLEKIVSAGDSFPLWMADLLRYEKAWLRAADSSKRLIVCRFRYPVNELARSITQENPLPELTSRPLIAFWFRPPLRSHIQHQVLESPHLAKSLIQPD